MILIPIALAAVGAAFGLGLRAGRGQGDAANLAGLRLDVAKALDIRLAVVELRGALDVARADLRRLESEATSQRERHDEQHSRLRGDHEQLNRSVHAKNNETQARLLELEREVSRLAVDLDGVRRPPFETGEHDVG